MEKVNDIKGNDRVMEKVNDSPETEEILTYLLQSGGKSE